MKSADLIREAINEWAREEGIALKMSVRMSLLDRLRTKLGGRLQEEPTVYHVNETD